MANENPNAKWITIHPNDAEEGKGKHILINKATGAIEGGNPHLVQALKEKGANVSPSAPTAPSGNAQKSEYDPDMGDLLEDGAVGFSAPKDDEFSELFEDEKQEAVSPTESEVAEMSSAFTPPLDDEFAGLLGEEAEQPKSKYSDDQLQSFINEHFAGAYGLDVLKKVIADNPKDFGISANGDLTSYLMKDDLEWELKYAEEGLKKQQSGSAEDPSTVLAKTLSGDEPKEKSGMLCEQAQTWLDSWNGNLVSDWEEELDAEGDEAIEKMKVALSKLDENDFEVGQNNSIGKWILTYDGAKKLSAVIAGLKKTGFGKMDDPLVKSLNDIKESLEKTTFPVEAVEKYVNGLAMLNGFYAAKKEKLKAIVEQHPEMFKSLPSGGIVCSNSENWQRLVAMLKDEPVSDAPKFTDEEITKIKTALKRNGWGAGVSDHIMTAITADNTLSAQKKNLVLEDLKQVLEPDLYNKVAGALGEGSETSAPKFTDEELTALAIQAKNSDEGKKHPTVSAESLKELMHNVLSGEQIPNEKAVKQVEAIFGVDSKIAKAYQDAFQKSHGTTVESTSQVESPSDYTPADTKPTPPAPKLPTPPPAKPVSAELTEGGYPFPKDAEALSGLTKVKALGGASGANATLYKDSNGNMFVMKRFDPSDKAGQQRIKEECDADAYYLAGGANVPHFKLYGDESAGYTKLSQYIPGTKTLGSVWNSADNETKDKIRSNLSQNFALDVMAGAWDVLGTGMDNVLVDADGNVWRCDNGGAFNRRAQGGEKDEANWGSGHIDDLWTMRGKAAGLDGKTVPDGTGKSEMFGGITTHQILSDIASRDWDKMIAHLPDATRQVMAKRIANAKEYHGVCDNVVTAGKYGDGQHSEDITLNYHCLNKFGMKAGCTNKDVGPKNWGWLRGDGNGNPAPTLSKFLKEEEPQLSDFTDAPEPKLESYLPSGDVNQAANILKTAGISLNKHLFVDKDGKPNMTSVDAALALKPKLEAVANGADTNAKKAKEMLAYVQQIEKMKEGGFQNLEKEMPHSPSGAVDLNTPESKAAAEESFKTAHAEWENKVANAKTEFEKAESEYAKKKAAAEKKLATAMKKWEAENGGKAFKYKNVTAAFEDFCKQNGIQSGRFWEMANGQGGSSQGEGSCHMKVLELLSCGGDLAHPYTSVNGVSDHSYKVKACADEYKTHPEWLKRDMKAYVAMKSLTQMILTHSSFVGNFSDRKELRLCRTESKADVIDGYDVKKGVPTVYNMGTHESFSVFKTATPFNHEAVICDVPYSRISSLYFLTSPKNNSMYLGDGENEAGVNAIGIPKVYWKHVSAGLPLTDAWKSYETAMKKPVVYAKSKNKATSM